MDTIEERDGWLFVAMRSTLEHEPVEIINLFPLGLRAYGLQDYIGRKVRWQHGVFVDDRNCRYALQGGPEAHASRQERNSVPEPKQRGKKLETRWMNGAWHKLTRNGWVRA